MSSDLYTCICCNKSWPRGAISGCDCEPWSKQGDFDKGIAEAQSQPNTLYAEIERLRGENERLRMELAEAIAALKQSDSERTRLEAQLAEMRGERNCVCDNLVVAESAIAEASELRRVLQAIQDDWQGQLGPQEWCQKYGLPTDSQDIDIDCWILRNMGKALASTPLAAAHMAKDEAIRQAFEDFQSIMNESEGVAGWHLNGDIAKWDEFNELYVAIDMVLAGKEAGNV